MVLICLQLSVYFDDFINAEVPSLAKFADLSFQVFLCLLGWDIAEDKENIFDSVAVVLGLKIDLSEARFGIIFFRNTESTSDEFFASILAAGVLSHKDGERLCGRLRFAEAQVAGKVACVAVNQLTRHVLSGSAAISDDTRAALLTLRDRIGFAPPRCIHSHVFSTVHLYVDASCDNDRAGLGGVLVSSAIHCCIAASAKVRALVNPTSKKTIIECETLVAYPALKVGEHPQRR